MPNHGDNPTNAKAISTRAPRIPRAEWEKHKGLIAMLYLDERRTLKEVMEYMSTVHQFNGTRRMFIRKIEEWKLDSKNVRKNVAVDVYLQTSEIGSEALYTVDGRQFSAEQVQRYRERKTRELLRLRAARHLAAAPLSLRLTDPEHLRSIEKLFLTIAEYIDGSFDSGTWTVGTCGEYFRSIQAPKSSKLNSIFDEFKSPTLMFAIRYHRAISKTQFLLLHEVFGALPHGIQSETPSLLYGIIGLYGIYKQGGKYEVADMLLRNASELSRCHLGTAHPLARIITSLAVGSLLDQKDVLIGIKDVLCSKWDRHLCQNNPEAHLLITGEIGGVLYSFGLLQEQENVLRKALNIAESTEYYEPTLNIMRELAWCLYQQRQFKEALSIAKQAAKHLDRVNLICQAEVFRLMGLSEIGLGNQKPGEEHLWQAVRAMEDYWGQRMLIHLLS